MRLLQITDTHLRSDPAWRQHGVEPRRRYAAVLAYLHEHAAGIDGLLVTGDISHDEGAVYGGVRADLEALGRPALVLPGNHDVPAAFAEAFPAAGAVAFTRERRLGGWRLLALDTQLPGAVHGRVGEAQLAWLARALEAAPRTPTLVVLHHQPAPVGTAWIDASGLADGPALCALLEGHPQVRAAVFGHVHQAVDRRTAGGLRLLAAPATSVQFRAGSAQKAFEAGPPGVRWLACEPQGELASWVARLPLERA
ncbi:metallophosphoesterase [Halorhodospira neutriphila]|uniref:metallophosphoesterase n=1 Tax=Halorhodospira neutriphila TaxID=168379 RepID=UPI0019045721